MSKLHDAEVDEYMRKSVSVEPLALNEEFIQLSSDLAYWGAHYADAFRQMLTTKLEFERTEARLRITHRELLIAQAGKTTESQVEAAVISDDEYNRAKLEAIGGEVEKVRLGCVLDAIRAKRDMLVSLGAQVRAEMSDSPRIRDEHQVRAGR